MFFWLESINHGVNQFVWGPGMIAVFLFTGIYLTVGCGWFQIRHVKLWIGQTLLSLFRSGEAHHAGEKGSISQFQSFCTALAATLGTGNITGVATAILTGGPGAVFWMWISAFFGMMTAYAESVLGIRYRKKDKDGNWNGGAMFYMEQGLHCRWLAVIFSICCIMASLGMGNMTQANAMAAGLKGAFGIPTAVTALLVMAVTALVLFGGIQRIGRLTERLVPFMAIFYLAGGCFVIFCHAEQLPEALASIVTCAFTPVAAGGGIAGYSVQQAVKMGVARGIFSNEAGLGTSVMAHAAAHVKEPAVQGMWAIFEVFVDTMIVCTITALVILTSGVYQPEIGLLHLSSGMEGVDGTTLTGMAFSTAIPNGGKFLAVATVLFAFATIIGWSYFGMQAVTYLFHGRGRRWYQLLYLFCIFPGCTLGSGFIWEVADTMNGMMAIPNLTALLLLSKEVFGITREACSRSAVCDKIQQKEHTR
ncbi:MAG: alanine/glycine:cation symporter family protein [Lachnospiraceae bacterium]|jgi:AGCS family alanine or glycine:cation symporter